MASFACIDAPDPTRKSRSDDPYQAIQRSAWNRAVVRGAVVRGPMGLQHAIVVWAGYGARAQAKPAGRQQRHVAADQQSERAARVPYPPPLRGRIGVGSSARTRTSILPMPP